MKRNYIKEYVDIPLLILKITSLLPYPLNPYPTTVSRLVQIHKTQIVTCIKLNNPSGKDYAT